jgi:WD40 repeat protein
VGADGSLRQFDTRDLTKSDILFEGTEPLMRLSQNKINDFQISFISMDQNYITIIDKRKPFVAAHKLYYHKNQGVNAIQFSPNDSNLLASAGSDGKALLWDTSEMLPEIKSPVKEYLGKEGELASMDNLIWSPYETNWVACCREREVFALKVDPKKGA